MAKTTFLITGGWALLCAPAILFAERHGWSQAPFHVTQLLATLVCFLSSVTFLVRSWASASISGYSLAVVAAILSGLWVAFACYVVLTFDLGAID